MIVQYVADDGKVFDSKTECEKYEEKFNEKAKRRKEVDDAYENYCNLLKAYNKDFGGRGSDELDYLKRIFNL